MTRKTTPIAPLWDVSPEFGTRNPNVARSEGASYLRDSRKATILPSSSELTELANDGML